MHRDPARGQERRLGIIGVPVIAAGHTVCVHGLRQHGRLVAPHARLAGPHRIAAAIQRKMAHLFAAAPHGFMRVGVEMQPQTIIRRVDRADRQAIGGQGDARDRGFAIAQDDRIAIAAPGGRRNQVVRCVVYAEIAAHHRHIVAPSRNCQRRTRFAVAQHEATGDCQFESRISCRKPEFHPASHMSSAVLSCGWRTICRSRRTICTVVMTPVDISSVERQINRQSQSCRSGRVSARAAAKPSMEWEKCHEIKFIFGFDNACDGRACRLSACAIHGRIITLQIELTYRVSAVSSLMPTHRRDR